MMVRMREGIVPGEDGMVPRCPEETEWLGRQDSNLRMAAPKAAALPLGDAPTEAAL